MSEQGREEVSEEVSQRLLDVVTMKTLFPRLKLSTLTNTALPAIPRASAIGSTYNINLFKNKTLNENRVIFVRICAPKLHLQLVTKV